MSKKLKFNQPAKLPLPEDFISHIKLSPKIYNGDCTQYFNQDEAVMYPTRIKETVPDNKKRFVFLVKRAEDCLFSRRLEYRGKIICGYSFVVRLFGFDITKC